MIFEATVSHISVDEEGYVKCIKERYVVDDKELFSEVEEMLLTKFSELNEVDIPTIKRSKVREIANKRATPRPPQRRNRRRRTRATSSFPERGKGSIKKDIATIITTSSSISRRGKRF